MGIRTDIGLYISSRKWRKINKHNSTTIRNQFDLTRVHVGKGTYGSLYVLMHNKNRHVFIGNYCSIAPEVAFIPESEHQSSFVSTFPFKAKMIDGSEEAISKGDIIIEDDVWIGYGAVILSGVRVGKGAIIGAGTIVARDIPQYAIVCGNPAKIIKYRFDEEIRTKLKSINYASLDLDKIVRIQEQLYKKVTAENVDKIINSINCLED